MNVKNRKMDQLLKNKNLIFRKIKISPSLNSRKYMLINLKKAYSRSKINIICSHGK